MTFQKTRWHFRTSCTECSSSSVAVWFKCAVADTMRNSSWSSLEEPCAKNILCSHRRHVLGTLEADCIQNWVRTVTGGCGQVPGRSNNKLTVRPFSDLRKMDQFLKRSSQRVLSMRKLFSRWLAWLLIGLATSHHRTLVSLWGLVSHRPVGQ